MVAEARVSECESKKRQARERERERERERKREEYLATGEMRSNGESDARLLSDLKTKKMKENKRIKQ